MVLGCQRSGTTLAFLMLTAHPRMVGLDELDSTGALPPWPVLLANAAAGKKTVFKLPRRSTQAELIAERFHGAHLIWMVRHPLAVVSSMRRLPGEEEQNWIQSYAAGELEYARQFFPEIGDTGCLDEIELGANVWKYKNMALARFRQRGMNPMVVRYEALLEQPREIMSGVLAQIGLPWSEHVVEHWKHHGQRTMIGGTRTDNPIDRSRLQPELALTPEERGRVLDICEELMVEFDYQGE